MSHPTNAVPPTATELVAVPCVDAIGRSRQLTITTSGGQVSLRTPPGELAVLHPAAAAHLADILRTLASPPSQRDVAAGPEGRLAGR
jgi:hypothetical protein